MRSFKDVNGQNIPFEDKSELDVELQTDIVTDEVTAYLVYCQERPYEVDKTVYDAVVKLINTPRHR